MPARFGAPYSAGKPPLTFVARRPPNGLSTELGSAGCCSNMVTWTPHRLSSYAATSPAIPPPTMATVPMSGALVLARSNRGPLAAPFRSRRYEAWSTAYVSGKR